METIYDRMKAYVTECLSITDTSVHRILIKIINTAAVSCDFNYIENEENSKELVAKLFTTNDLNNLKIFIDNVVRYGDMYNHDDYILSLYFPKNLIFIIRKYNPVLIAMAYLNYSHAAQTSVIYSLQVNNNVI